MAGIRKTLILPPAAAVEIVWAYTGRTTEDNPSREVAEKLTEVRIEDLKQAATDSKDPDEKQYVTRALLAMEVCIRNMDIIYKARKLNFDDNKELRTGYLETVKDTKDFGLKLGDLVKSLPGLTIGPAASIPFLVLYPSTTQNPVPIQWWIIPAILSAIGYVITIFAAKLHERRTLKTYVRMDYERTQYYEQYLNKSEQILNSLYEDIDSIHHEIFKQKYPSHQTLPKGTYRSSLKIMIDNAAPSRCKYIHNHFKCGLITHTLWPDCETGDKPQCELWNKVFEKKSWHNLRHVQTTDPNRIAELIRNPIRDYNT